MPHGTYQDLSKPEARGLEWLSEQLDNEKCSWTLHESGLISTVPEEAPNNVAIVLSVQGTVKFWSEDPGKHISVLVLPKWYEDCLDENRFSADVDTRQYYVCVHSPTSPTATDACVSLVIAADAGEEGLSKVSTIREAIFIQKEADKALMDSALLSAKELFLKAQIHPEIREAWALEDWQAARLAYNAGYYEFVQSFLRDNSNTLETSNLRRKKRLGYLIRINELGREIDRYPGMLDEDYREALEHCRDEDWVGCDYHLQRGHQALRDWRENQRRQASLKKKVNRKLERALFLKAKYPSHTNLNNLCEEAITMAEAENWHGALQPLEQVTKIGHDLEWEENLAEALRAAQSNSW